MEGEGIDERGFRIDNNQEVVRIDNVILGLQKLNNCSEMLQKQEKLGWVPRTTLEMIKEIAQYDKQLAGKALLKNKGYKVYSSFENLHLIKLNKYITFYFVNTHIKKLNLKK